MLLWKYWPWTQGGTERQCRSMSHALSRLGVDVTVVTHWPGGRIPRAEMDGAVRIVRLGALAPVARAVEWGARPALRLLRRPGQVDLMACEMPVSRTPSLLTPLFCLDLEKRFFVSSVRRFFRRKRGEFDLIHVHESHWIAGLGVDVGQRSGLPVLVKEASYPVLGALDVTSPCRGRFDALRRQARYLALTPEAAIQLAEQGVPKEWVATVSNGVDVPTTPTDPASNTLVLCVANLSQGNYWKSFSTLLDSWPEVRARHPSAILAMVGGGDARPCMQYAERRGVADSVRFPGESKDVASWYRQAAVFVLPSKCEGMSNALLEAQGWGVPAVVSDIPGNRAVVMDGVNGIIFPVGDSHRLAAGIARLLDSAPLRRSLGLEGRRRIETSHLFPVVASQLLTVYRDTLSDAASRPS